MFYQVFEMPVSLFYPVHSLQFRECMGQVYACESWEILWILEFSLAWVYNLALGLHFISWLYLTSSIRWPEVDGNFFTQLRKLLYISEKVSVKHMLYGNLAAKPSRLFTLIVTDWSSQSSHSTWPSEIVLFLIYFEKSKIPPFKVIGLLYVSCDRSPNLAWRWKMQLRKQSEENNVEMQHFQL